MSELTIREMENGEEFADWFSDLATHTAGEAGESGALDEHYLILSNAIGDWIGGLRYSVRGGVAQVQDIAVRPEEQHRGHGHRLLEAFEEGARDHSSHLAEFWTDDLSGEAELLAHGWERVVKRTGYIGGGTWYLMEKSLVALGGGIARD